jgi:type I restriction enzyme, S subunit
LGKIPKEWDVTKVKNYYDIRLGKMLQPMQKKTSDQLVPYLCTINTDWNGLRLNTVKSMWFSKSEMLKYDVLNGDLIVNEGGDAGKSCIVDGLETSIFIQNSIHRVRPRSGLPILYLHYWLYFVKSIQYIELICNKATIMHFTVDKFNNFEVLKPKKDEIVELIHKLDDSVMNITSVIEKQKKLINKLKSAKQSLISEAVTGKIDLRDWEIIEEGEMQ